MSTAKRSRRRLADGRSVSPQPDAKRPKVAKAPHGSVHTGLGFLVDEDVRGGKKLEARLTNGLPTSKTTRVDESRTIVAPDTVQYNTAPAVKNQPGVVDISSDEDSSSLDDEEDGDEQEGEQDATKSQISLRTGLSQAPARDVLTNGFAHEADDEEDAHGELANPGANQIKIRDVRGADDMEVDEGQEEPTFGDLLKARHPEPIDIAGSGPLHALVPAPNSRGLAPPSSTSLGTVLTQALKTNDSELLESCFKLNHLGSIRSTIQRLPSPYVGNLLQRIAERIHKRPGRTGSLMVWIQWSLVAHGAYLANQPDVMQKVQSLAEVIRARASGLQPLLHLKGKLDLLSAQLELRRTLKESAEPTDEDDEEEALYIEAEDEDDLPESDDTDDEFADSVTAPQQLGRHGKSRSHPGGLTNGLTNGINDESSDEDDVDTDEDELLDIEAEEASDGSGDDDVEQDSDEGATSNEGGEEEEDFDNSEDEESEIEVRAPKANTLNRKR